MIELQNLTKKFKDRVVLNDVGFRVERGEIFGYLGPNGAGKTTTLRIILGLLRPTTGKALVWGKDLGTDDLARRKVGVLLENDGLYDRLSAYGNLDYYARLYGVAERERKIEGLLDLVGLAERGGDKVGKYSRGMKRKLGLARAIIHDPEVLFLDEPAAGLDPEAQKMIRDLITHLSRERNITVFLNSHDLDEVQRICSRVAILQNGEIRAYDTIENLAGANAKPVVDITIADAEQVGQALSLMASLDYVLDAKPSNHGIRATLSVKEKSSDLLAYLAGQGIKIEELRREARSLEDIYLDVVRKEAKK